MAMVIKVKDPFQSSHLSKQASARESGSTKHVREDGYGSIKNLVDNAYRSGVSRQAAISELKSKRGDIIYPHIVGKLKDCFNNSPFNLERISGYGDIISARISGDFEDGSHYWADLDLNTRTLGMNYVNHHGTNWWGKSRVDNTNSLQVRIPGVKATRVIPLDESPHLTARTPQAVRDGYLTLKDFIHGLRDKFEPENGKIPGVAELDKEIDNLDRGGTHPLLSPGIT